MKNGKKVEDLILKKLEALDSKVDKLATEKIPGLLVDVAVLNEKTSKTSKLYSIVGGGAAVVLSVGTSIAIALWK